MDFAQPDESAAAAESMRQFAETEILPVIKGYEERQEFPHPIIEKMGAAGFFGAAFPEELGGSDMGYLAVAAIAEEVSRMAPEFGYAMNMQAMTCPFTIYNWGNADQIRRFVPDLIAGRKIGMFALTEPGGGSDAAGSMKTTARLDGGVYRLNGSKQWITFADACDTGLLFAKTDPEAGHRGITAFIVEPKSHRGFTANPIEMSGLSKCLRSSAVFLDDFPVPVENRLGEEGGGFKIAMNALEWGRLTVSARLVGLAQRCLDEASRYATERVVGGQAIGRYQMVQHLIADMAVNVEAARLMTRRMAWTMDRGEASNRAASQAKYFAGIAAKHAAQSAAEIFAGYALADEYPISKMTAYVNMLCIGEGTPNVQRILIAEDALGYKDANRHPVRNPRAKG
ncbi:MAG: acyl-CoA dehydrogenase family protein [Rhodospirillales bacterium]|jgi:isovaleryl-CoA dehydrogenase|nr:acyl-CoA dehydrogenase family protein [Rhodospirillales bacterium]